MMLVLVVGSKISTWLLAGEGAGASAADGRFGGEKARTPFPTVEKMTQAVAPSLLSIAMGYERLNRSETVPVMTERATFRARSYIVGCCYQDLRYRWPVYAKNEYY